MFKKIFNYIILFGLIYLVFMHNNEKFVETTPEPSVKKKKKNKVMEENNTDVNSLIDSVIEEELFSQPISEEEAMEGMAKNESTVVDKFYKMFNNNQEDEEEEMEDMAETNIEEYMEESIDNSTVEQNVMPRDVEDESYAETEEEESMQSSKSAFKCANNMIPKFSHKKGKKNKPDNMNIYKPKSSRIRNLQKIDKSVPKTVRRVFEEKIVDFKKTNKLSANQKERIQGCFMMGNNENSKFSTFEADSESPYDMDINANDVNFENYSLI